MQVALPDAEQVMREMRVEQDQGKDHSGHEAIGHHPALETSLSLPLQAEIAKKVIRLGWVIATGRYRVGRSIERAVCV